MVRRVVVTPAEWARLRIGDVEREQAAAALGEHYVQGRLDPLEHAERLDAVWSARVRGDLDVLFHDLPRPAAPTVPLSSAPTPRRRTSLPPVVVCVAAVLGFFLLTSVLRTAAPAIVVLAIAWLLVRRQRGRSHPGPSQGPSQGPPYRR